MHAHTLAAEETGKARVQPLSLHSGKQALPARAGVEKWLLGRQLTVSFTVTKLFLWIDPESIWFNLIMSQALCHQYQFGLRGFEDCGDRGKREMR